MTANCILLLLLQFRMSILLSFVGLFCSIALHFDFDPKAAFCTIWSFTAYFFGTGVGIIAKKISSYKISDYVMQLKSVKDKLESYTFFMQYVSHEIRIPLQGIKGVSGLLLSKSASSLDTLHYLNILQASCTQLLLTASNVLDFTKFIEQYRVLNRTECNLQSIIHSVVEEMLALSVLQNSRITVHCNLTEIYIDGPKMTHIMRNLLSNALQNTKNGKISIQAFLMKGELLYVSVIDTGVGISVEEMNKIFDKFSQAALPSKTDANGIGLLIVSYFIRMHLGTVWVEQNFPHGSIFAFSVQLNSTMPSHDKKANVQNRNNIFREENIFWNNVKDHTLQMAKLWINKAVLHALIIDDDDLSLLSSKLILESVGFIVLQAKSCVDAVEILKNKKVALILLDIVIGKDDVNDCLDQICAQSPNANVILQTGITRSFFNQTRFHAGVIGYLLKPYGKSDLERILLALCRA